MGWLCKIIILDQPPVLPTTANRASIRNGARPPFVEDPSTQQTRTATNAFLLTLTSEKIGVIHITNPFQLPGGDVRFLDDQGRQLYHDNTHLSGYGTDLIRPVIQTPLIQHFN